jgi:hypothetical protein
MIGESEMPPEMVKQAEIADHLHAGWMLGHEVLPEPEMAWLIGRSATGLLTWAHLPAHHAFTLGFQGSA